MLIGLLFIVIGILTLLKNLGIVSFQGGFWSVFYPLALIMVGLYLVLAVRRGKKRWDWVRTKFIDNSDD